MRVVVDEATEAPLFVARDVCEVLGISKYRDAISRLDEDEGCPVVVDTPGGPQTMTAVTESGLYALVLQSRKPEARLFRKWVTGDVLPMIRRTGRYAAAEGERLDPADIRLKRAENAIAALTARLHAVETELRTVTGRLLGARSTAEASRMLLGAGRSRYYGVVETRPGRFRARLGARGRTISLGVYRSAEAAARAYDAALVLHGLSHTRPLNFPADGSISQTLHPTA